ncbi:hypothetical protein [Alteribacter keqinensis]|uniref:Uncharacterized protein n=1 Tax=Alteribacter keqinensis TaxID=2483800 RepID=A0A3M7TT75_9BACI|nr:hypothetical protein [Alteribacter keqinensis]RNA68850.1 hypothetical protein EBO34_02470 [Alteribacter keqinensis]
MGPFLLRCFFITTVFFGGFVFGIVYVNHLSGSFGTLEPSSLQLSAAEEPQLVQIEDGDHLVIYEEGDEGIKEELVTTADVYRELAEKQSGSKERGSVNLFSEVGLRLADTFEAIFKGIYGGLG